MALINCRECGREISDAAPACPGCGCPKVSAIEPQAPKPPREISEPPSKANATEQLGMPPMISLGLILLVAVVLVVLLNQNRIAKETTAKGPDQGSRTRLSGLSDSKPAAAESHIASPSRALRQPTKAVVPTATATLIDEAVHDSPIKTEISQYFLVDKEISTSDLRTLLAQRSAKASLRSGFKYRAHPDAIYIYAYDSREKAETERYHNLWVAMSQQSPGDKAPRITIDEDRLHGIERPPLEIGGFSESERMQIYKDLSEGERRAGREARQKYPTDVFKQIDLEETLFQKYRAVVRSKYGIEEAFCFKVIAEGVKNKWPD